MSVNLLPYRRTGLAAALRPAPSAAGQVQVSVTMSSGGPPIPVTVGLYGPGEVVGLDPRQILRTDPSPGAQEVEPNYFPLIEFAAPDLPWMFTPTGPVNNRLAPWLVLVVVPAADAEVSPAVGGRPDVLRTTSGKLPDLSSSALWAHTQVSTLANTKREFSRLVCPQTLAPSVDYLAAVVPAFESGRRAGLGLAPGPTTALMDPAWTTSGSGSASSPVELPIYHSWTFRTGGGGDFESLVRALKRVPAEDLPAGLNVEIPPIPSGSTAPPAGTAIEATFPGVLGAPARFTWPLTRKRAIGALINGAKLPAGWPLPLPLYGRWHAGVARFAIPGQPTWLASLNSDPRYRAAAAWGAQLVRDRQEELMSAAWRQVGQIERANALLRASQLARSAARVLHGRLAAHDPASLLLLAGPMLARGVGSRPEAYTIAAEVRASRLPVAMTDAAFRRMLRPRGALARRAGIRASDLVNTVNDGTEVVTPRRPTPPGIVVQPFGDLNQWKENAQQWPRAIDASVTNAVRAQQLRKLRGELVDMLNVMLDSLPKPAATTPPRPALDLQGLRDTLVAATDPQRTIPARMAARVKAPAGWRPTDPLQPIMLAPRIDSPLAPWLVQAAPSVLLPGIADLPPDSVTALIPNQAFIESLMVGANHEFSGELLWRGFPTDQRGTVLHRFWDRSGAAGPQTDDIPAIDGWSADLGGNSTGDTSLTFLVLRGQLLRRYPRTLIYAIPAMWVDKQGRKERVPVPSSTATPAELLPAFSGRIEPDITYVGFSFPNNADVKGKSNPAANNPGWFFVFSQDPGEPRFGIDIADPEPDDPEPFDLAALWSDSNKNSATVANTWLQRRFRAAIHASDLLPSDLLP